MITDKQLQDIYEDVLVFDLETSSFFSDGTPINISTHFKDYVERAKVKWFGAWSGKYNKYYEFIAKGNEDLIMELLEEHNTLVGFNSDEFDFEILKNNNLVPEVESHHIDYRTGQKKIYPKRFLQVDMKVILGDSVFLTHKGYGFKARGKLMGYKFPNNKLKTMAEVMGLETQKGDIDYTIFYKDEWTPEEEAEIIRYLRADVEATKQMFDKTIQYWKPFTRYISDENIMNLSWIRSSIASLRYKGDCHTLGVPEDYGEATGEKEQMGGNVIEPKYEEAENVVYLDFGSLYPWLRNMFCIDNEVPIEKIKELISQGRIIFHGNDVFKVKGYYDVTEPHPLAKQSIENLTMRTELKKTDPKNPMIYTIKIYENSGYGVLRSPIFVQSYKPTGGWDICWLGQQFQELIREMMDDFGFETIAGDTDSIFVKAKKEEYFNETYIRECLGKCIKKILDNVPMPNDLFMIDIEDFVEYIMFPFSLEPVKGEDGKNLKEGNRLVKKRKGKKKNYVYLVKNKKGEFEIVTKGIVVKKDNSTKLGAMIYKKILQPLILSRKRAKFKKSELDYILDSVLKKEGMLEMIQKEYRVKPANTYAKPKSQIQAQISTGYFNGQDGVINLIKNKKVGNAGKGKFKYGTPEEIRQAGVTLDDIDLTSVKNELAVFELYESDEE